MPDMPSNEPAPRPVPCPECGETEGYEPIGPFRSLCNACGALLKNEEVKRDA